jgi:hypothetical protein
MANTFQRIECRIIGCYSTLEKPQEKESTLVVSSNNSNCTILPTDPEETAEIKDILSDLLNEVEYIDYLDRDDRYSNDRDHSGLSNSDEMVIETSDKRLFVIHLSTWFGPCMSGWIPCTIGNFSIEPCNINICKLITHIPRFESFVSLDARYFDEDHQNYFEESNFECEYFSYDRDSGDRYYPNGFSSINYEHFIKRDEFFNCRRWYLSFVDGINPEAESENLQVLRYLLNDCITRELSMTLCFHDGNFCISNIRSLLSEYILQ